MAITVTEIEAYTKQYWEPGVQDQYFLGNIFMYKLLKQGKKYSGGKWIETTISYGPPHGGAFNAQSTFDTTKYEEATAAQFRPAYYYEPITFDFDDKVLNSGDAKIYSIVDDKLTMAQEKIRFNMAYDLYNNSDYGATNRGILGLPAMVSTTSTYGGIAVADIAEWISGYVSSTAAPIRQGVLRDLRTGCLTGDTQKDEVSMFVTTRTLLDSLRGQLHAQKVYHEDSEAADMGFRNVYFEGTPVYGDYMCPSTYLYGFNEHYGRFISHTDHFFNREPWAQPVGKPLWTCQIIWVGQFFTKRRKANGLRYGLTA